MALIRAASTSGGSPVRSRSCRVSCPGWVSLRRLLFSVLSSALFAGSGTTGSWLAARRARLDRCPVAGDRHARPDGQLEAGQRAEAGGCVEPGHAVRPGLPVLPGLATAHRDPERRIEAELGRPAFQRGREQGGVPRRGRFERAHVAQLHAGHGQHGVACRVDRGHLPAAAGAGLPLRADLHRPADLRPGDGQRLEPGREHPAVRDAGLQHVHDGVVQPRAAQHQHLVHPGRAGPWCADLCRAVLCRAVLGRLRLPA